MCVCVCVCVRVLPVCVWTSLPCVYTLSGPLVAFTPDTPHTVSHEFGKSRPIRSQEYTHLESQLERQMMDHHLKLRMEQEQRAQDPFYHPLEDEDPLNQSLSDLTAEETFYSIELSTSSVYDGDLPPLGNPPKLSLRSDQFHSIKSTSSASPSNYSHVGTESITSTKSIRTVVSKATDYNQVRCSRWSVTPSSTHSCPPLLPSPG